MPKGKGRPNNRAERMIIKGLKMARRKGTGRRNNAFPGAEGTPRGAGTFSVNKKKRK